MWNKKKGNRKSMLVQLQNAALKKIPKASTMKIAYGKENVLYRCGN